MNSFLTLSLRLFTLGLGCAFTILALADAVRADVDIVRVVDAPGGQKLQVDDRDFMVFGMNWGYIPIGQNYLYSLWNQPDEVIISALEREMSLLKAMGVNTIRQYVGIPPRWVQYIYERWGIYTVLNHPCARYGFTLDGVWIPAVDYSDPRLREAVKAEVLAMVDEFRGTPGILMWLLGNENNYGLSWSSFEIEALPQGERDAARARYLYSLFGEITDAIHARDELHPVAIANGDVQYIDLIAEECSSIDVFGTNVYRGLSARDLFEVVDQKLGVPVVFTEFGADAFNAREMREDQAMQARYLTAQWEEIYEQSAGKGRVGNAIGGLVFQWSDGWWKFGQESRLDIHDTNASWPNAGYAEDYVPGQNNMNEEWWGVCAKGPADSRGLYDLYPRAAYYALRSAFRLDPYASDTDIARIRAHFARIQPAPAVLEARGDHASLIADALKKVHMSGLRMEFETYNTGGDRLTTPDDPIADASSFPSFLGFDRMESFYADFEAQPTEALHAEMSINVLGNVPSNPIDEIFYENRGRTRRIATTTGNLDLQGIERIKVYRGSVSWDDPSFQMNAFYRVGHTHWGYEGDFFGLYRDAYYGENVDIYNGEAPVGMEIAAKKKLHGLKIAFGPQLWWGANPAVMGKYQWHWGKLNLTAVAHEDIDRQSTVNSSLAVPEQKTRKATLQLETKRGPWGLVIGGIWSGQPKIGNRFTVAEKQGAGYDIQVDEVLARDTLGAKVKLTWEKGPWHAYAQSAYMGVVADAGPTATITYTGWQLKDSGSGNQKNVLAGVAVNVGKFQIAPNFLWQKPIIGPVPADAPSPARPRNILQDPFAVRANRQTTAGEILLSYDPTPATWMWAWDNDVREDARFAGSVGFVFRHHPTTQDAAIGILGDGTTTFPFPGAPPARDLWEVNARAVSRLSADRRFVGHLYFGTGEPNGSDPRLVHRYGADARLDIGSNILRAAVKINDWGPYDYHRDFNLTFPIQWIADVSHTLGRPSWFDFPQTQIGVRATWRSLDENSPRYDPVSTSDPGKVGDDGREWEIRTYLHVAL